MKIKLHPLFIAVGIFSAVFGGLPVFFIYVLTALLHECGHIFCAARYGFECKSVSLMPYGAAAVCDLEGISPTDEIFLALSGPAVNLITVLFVAGLWWFYPDSYAYTDIVFTANLTMLCVNLMPAYPLDGGRVVGSLLKKFLKPKSCEIILKIISCLVAVALILIYALSYRNFSLLFFAGFLVFSTFQKKPPVSKITFSKKKLRRGREVRRVIMDKTATYKDALRLLNGDTFLVVEIHDKKFLDEIYEDELLDRLKNRSVYDKIYE